MAEGPVLVIEAGRAERHYWADLWRYRELLWFLAWRDLLVRYRQTAIGIAWAILRPLLTMVVFTLVFGRLAGLPSEGVPYAVLVLVGLLPWQLFASAFTEAGASVVSNAGVIAKVYFPRLIVPVSALGASLVDFLIALALLGLVMAWYGHVPDWRMATLPLFALVAVAAALGAGVWTAALNVRYRDVRFVVPFAVQLGLYVSPVGFSSAVVPEPWRLVYALNPMVGVIDGFRWALLGGAVPVHWPGVLLSLAVIAVVLATGVAYFRRTEKTFADVI